MGLDFDGNFVDVSFKCGGNFKIGHFCVIEEDVIVGNHVTLENWVLLKKGTRIGNNVFIDHYCKTGEGVVVGNDVQWKPSASIADGTIIEDNAFIGPLCMSLRGRVSDFPISPLIKESAYIGAGVIIMPGITVGLKAVAGAGAILTKNVPDGATVVGNPAKIIKWVNS